MSKLLLLVFAACLGFAFGDGKKNGECRLPEKLWGTTVQATSQCSSYRLKAGDDSIYAVFIWANLTAPFTTPEIVYDLHGGDTPSHRQCTDDGPCTLPLTIVNVESLWINFQKGNTSPITITAIANDDKCKNLPAIAIIAIVAIPFGTIAFIAVLIYKCCKRRSANCMELKRLQLMQQFECRAQNATNTAQAAQLVHQPEHLPIASFPPPPMYETKQGPLA